MDAAYGDGGRPRGLGHGQDLGSSESPGVVVPFGENGAAGAALQKSVRHARQHLNLRKKLLGTECFSGPAWEVLLHLFESHVMQRRDTIGSVCDGTDVPATTVLRWIYRLEESRLIVVRSDHLDGRRRFVELSDSGIEAMTKYFAGLPSNLIAA